MGVFRIHKNILFFLKHGQYFTFWSKICVHWIFQVEDQNFALFNYVTEMNNQVEGLQESIAKLRTDIKEAKGRGDERERQQRDQLQNMERRVALSIREADTAEAKLELMEGVIDKLKVCNLFSR